MAGLIDQIMEDIVRSVGSSIKTRVAAGAGSSGGGGGGSTSIGHLPELPELPGATTPSYTPQPYGGPTVAQTAVATATGKVVAGAVNAAIAQLPSLNQSIALQLAQSQAAAFGAFGSKDEAKRGIMAASAGGTATSLTDAAVAMQRAGLTGFGGKDIGAYSQSIQSISNVMPGLGLSGAADVYASSQAGRNVNMAKLIGVQLRDQAGHPKSIDDIVNQLWQQLNTRKSVGREITKADIAFALLPGNSLDFTLSQYFSGNEDLRQTVIQMLYAKASGVSGFTKDEMSQAGITTGVIVAQSKRTTAKLGLAQEFDEPYLVGVRQATNDLASVVNGLTASFKALGIAAEGLAYGKGFNDTMQGSGKADGGPTSASVPYVVGERGPEVFIPSTNGVVVPNHKLPESMRMPMPAKYAADGSGKLPSGHSPVTSQNVNYGGVKIEINVPATFSEEKMVRELKRMLDAATIERKAKTK